MWLPLLHARWRSYAGGFFLLLLTLGCTHDIPEPHYSFYHWQTRLQLATAEQQLLEEFSADRLYVKAFDLTVENGRVEPTALLEVADASLPELVPVVFITNEVFREAETNLAENTVRLVRRLLPLGFTEVQFDCDWTAGTQVQYFSFLRAVAALLPESMISCTVRLHQYRDRDAQGIPPVDRATLMAYNTGELGEWDTENSIVDTTVIGNYVEEQPAYPLPLDLAVAVYDWAAVYRRDELAYLINEPELSELGDTSRFEQLTPLRYRVRKSTYYSGLYLYAGDLLRREIAGREAAQQLAEKLWPQIATPGSRRILFYRIGSRQWR